MTKTTDRIRTRPNPRDPNVQDPVPIPPETPKPCTFNRAVTTYLDPPAVSAPADLDADDETTED